MAQMYSSDPIDEFILENCFHIYEKQDREKVLKCLLNEKNKIDYFLDSNEYLNFSLNFGCKYIPTSNFLYKYCLNTFT